MKSKSLHCTSVSELQQTLEALLTSDFEPTLGIVFNSIKHDSQQIISTFNQFNLDLIGCTTAGEIVNEELSEQSIAVLLLDMKREHYAIQTFRHTRNLYETAQQAGEQIKNTFAEVSLLVLSSALGSDVVTLVEGVNQGLERPVPMYGGVAGDDLEMQTTYAYSNDFYSKSGTVILALDSTKISLKGLATCGWEAIGTEKVITKSEGHVIYEIDHEPAYDVFIRYFGLTSREDYLKSLLSLQTNYPLQIIRNGDSIMRSPMMIDEAAGTLILMGRVQEGDKFRFSNSPGFDVVEQTVEEFIAWSPTAPDADAMILFSCKGRHGAFGPMIEDEIAGIYNHWKTPMIGFLSYGEIGNTANGVCEFHNETCVLAVLKEII